MSLALTVGACTRIPQTNREEPDPRTAMAAAESLSTAGRYEEAAAGFASVAGLYPGSRYAKQAAWNAAILYGSPMNSAPDDSAAMRWLQVYRGYPLEEVERQSAEACLFYLQRITALKGELALKSSEMAGRAGRIRELENQLRQVTEELMKMKEIDVKLHQRGGKK